jgi:hypothetical protein
MKSINSELPPFFTSGSRGTIVDLEDERVGCWFESGRDGGLKAESVGGLSAKAVETVEAVDAAPSSGRTGCSEVGRVERTKSAKSLVSSVITLGSRGMKPDLRVLVFIGSGRDVKGLGGRDLRISDTRGTTFFVEGFLVKLLTVGELGLLEKEVAIGEPGFAVGWETPS